MGAKLCSLRNSGAAAPPSDDDDDDCYRDERVGHSRSFLRRLKRRCLNSAAEERIVEVESTEEFESCQVGNPIRMYTEGLSRVSLENEGSRYFISSSAESCKNGLKFHQGSSLKWFAMAFICFIISFRSL